MIPMGPDPEHTARMLRLIHAILADLRDGRDAEARAKLGGDLEGALRELPEPLAQRTRDRFASAYGSLLTTRHDPRHAEEVLRDLRDLYSDYIH